MVSTLAQCSQRMPSLNVSTYTSLTHVNVNISGGNFWDWDDFDHLKTAWLALWDGKDKGEKYELRIKLWDTALDRLFPERLPILPFLHVVFSYSGSGGSGVKWDQYKALGQEFSEAFDRMKREVEIEYSNGGNRVACGGGWVQSLGYTKSYDGDYIDWCDRWVPDLDDETLVHGCHDAYFDEFDEWILSLEEFWDAGKDKQTRKYITSPGLLRPYP